MNQYYVKRIVSAILTILLIATVTFFMMKAIPGGPFSRERALPAEIIAALNNKYKLNDPLFKQYVDYMLGLFTFDLGPSFRRLGYTVNELIAIGFPVSAKIGFLAIMTIVLIGIPLGVISALRQSKLTDYVVMVLATLGVTIPSFVLATLYIYFFAGKWKLVPAFGLESGLAYIGPVLALSGYSISFVARLTRSSMLEVLRQDYVRTAKASGLSEFQVVFKYALKNALIPVITYMGPMIAAILTGSFVVERIFALPGMGYMYVEGVNNRDYTVIMGTTVFYAIFYVVMVLLVDIGYTLADPRIRLGKKYGE
ncbi:MAG: ABC transporter permease [Candidatus Izemoplasmatales bacterium]|nr:ABC transporter permease [bacterium]MDZ4195922.1 ABC transporter permease [Candidatus Izemoplasmatales bacterium]